MSGHSEIEEAITGPHELMAPQKCHPAADRQPGADRWILRIKQLLEVRGHPQIHKHPGADRHPEEVGDLTTPFHAPARTSPVPPAWMHAWKQLRYSHQPSPSCAPQPPSSWCSPHPAASRDLGMGGQHRPRQERPQPTSQHSQGER